MELVLFINGTIVNSTTITLLQAGNSYTLSYSWTPTVEGTYDVTAYAHPMSVETSVENNQMTEFITVAGVKVAPFWTQWWLWTIVAVVIVALAGAVYFFKKRKPPTPITPPPPTEGTLQITHPAYSCHSHPQTKTTQNTNPLNSYLPFF